MQFYLWRNSILQSTKKLTSRFNQKLCIADVLRPLYSCGSLIIFTKQLLYQQSSTSENQFLKVYLLLCTAIYSKKQNFYLKHIFVNAHNPGKTKSTFYTRQRKIAPHHHLYELLFRQQQQPQDTQNFTSNYIFH